ncbi:MAG: A/G-specific adenine glycosylase [Deltaproteobacteria bacterium RBG_13_52_11b]|nr:MAG: A/G-specific adenine glycosylase [Deltaproteobacteria bacterium RBG_13_52_11b]
MISDTLRNNIQQRLLRWFEKNKRELPWRKTRDPYAIWISEMMLQQTQVATVIPYYLKFLKLFPTVRHLARADLSDVLRVWEGLGYYSRARNLHKAARTVVILFNGKIPDNPEDLLSLPGVGRYTAGAILSIAFNRESPVLDGNVKRVLSRLYAIPGDPKERKIEERLWDISGSLIPKGNAHSFNQALMELGATICIPKEPLCLLCPLQQLCRARKQGNPESYPKKVSKKAIPHVEAVSAVIIKEGRVLLKHRPPRGLLGGLWEFPNWEIEKGKDLKRSLKNHLKKEMALTAKVDGLVGTLKHTYSHFRLTLHVYYCQIPDGKASGKWVSARNLHHYPMSRLHRRIAQVTRGELGR